MITLQRPLSFALLLIFTTLGGCTLVKIVDTAAGAAVDVTVGAVKTTGKVIGAAIPDSDDKKKDEDK